MLLYWVLLTGKVDVVDYFFGLNVFVDVRDEVVYIDLCICI